MTNEESLKADRDLAAQIIATIFDHDSGGVMHRHGLYAALPDTQDERIDVILTELSDAGFLLADEDTLFLSGMTLAELGGATRGVCRKIAERAVKETAEPPAR